MRVGTWINGFWVSANVVLEQTSLLFTLSCIGGAIFCVMHGIGLESVDNIVAFAWIMGGGYLLALAVFPTLVLLTTAIILVVLSLMYAHVNWGWF